MNDRFLVDTNAWIFFFEDSPKLHVPIAEVLEDVEFKCFVSIASVWEAAIKVGQGKLKLGYDVQKDLPRIFEENGIELLAIDFEDAVGVQNLPRIHGDPFDRLQAVQATRRGWTVLSHDPVFDAYGIKRIGP